MTQIHFATAFVLMQLMIFPVYCSDDNGKEEMYEDSPLQGRAHIQDDRHGRVTDIIKRNPFKEDGDIFGYIDSLNKALRSEEPRNKPHFIETTYDALCLDHAHKTALQIYYRLAGLDGMHPIIFHHIEHEQDKRTIKLDMANVMTIDEDRRLREVESVIKWDRMPERLKGWAKRWNRIITGEYVSIVHKPLLQDNLILYPEAYLGANWPRPEGNALNQFYVYWFQSPYASKYIYMDKFAKCFMTRKVAMYLYPLNQPDITELKGSVKNTMAHYFGEAVVPITRTNGDNVVFYKLEITGLLRDFATTEVIRQPKPGKPNKFITSKKLVTKPYTFENKGFELIYRGLIEQGFYELLEENAPAPQGDVRQVWLREPASSNGRLEVQLDGVKVDRQWAAPLSKIAPDLVPSIKNGNLVVDLSTVLYRMCAEDYKELGIYLRSAYLMGMDSVVLECFPKDMSLSDKGFFRESPADVRLIEVVDADRDHINAMARYWSHLHYLIESFKGLSWLKFYFAAGLLFKEGQCAENLTEAQRSQLLSKLVGIKQIHLPKVKLAPLCIRDILQTISNNRDNLTHVDFTGAIGLKEIDTEFAWGVKQLPQLKYLSVIQSDFGKNFSRAVILLTDNLKDKKNLKELKLDMPYSTWAAAPKTIMYPVGGFTVLWANTNKLEKALFFFNPIGATASVICSAAATVCGLKQDLASFIWEEPVFTYEFGEEFVQTYQNLIQIPNLENLTLNTGGYQQACYNRVRSQFISDHNKLHKEAPPVQIEFMN
ncbi:MAG: hypothetical protein KBB83_06940 [Alphaproteobacteria bacterium]|nr:hypothetical protein [Alphaproteobacteria bacterium]